MKVSLKMLKLYCYESWGCILRSLSEMRSYNVPCEQLVPPAPNERETTVSNRSSL